jgi:hypothetical protein
MRARIDRLAAAAAAGSVPGELVPSLESMLEIVFESGRPSNRAVLQAIFARTPRGRELAQMARDVSRALQTLRGQVLADLRISSAGPAHHTLTIETDRCRLTVEIGRGGAQLASLETGA